MKTKTDFVLSVDIGTSTLKAALFDEHANIVLLEKQSLLEPQNNPSKKSGKWLRALKEIILRMRPYLESISAACISGNGPTIVSEDGTTLLWNEPLSAITPDKPITPGNVIKPDRPIAPDNGITPPSQTKLDSPIAPASGSARQTQSAPSIFIPRLLEFKSRYPLQWNDSEKIFSGPEYLIWRLTSAQVTILPEIRYKAAYWDDGAAPLPQSGGIPQSGHISQSRPVPESGRIPQSGTPLDAVFEYKKLCPFVAPGSFCGEVTQQGSSISGLLQGTKIFAGGPDFIAALIGTGTIFSGEWCDRAGTSEGINLCTTRPVFAEGLRTLPSLNGLWNASYLIENSGLLLNQASEKAGRNFKALHKINDFILYAMQNKNSQEYSALDSIAQTFADGVKKIEQPAKASGEAVSDTITITGGQASSKEFILLKAAKAGKKIAVTQALDAELLGDAILARYGLGEYNSIENAAKNLIRKTLVQQ